MDLPAILNSAAFKQWLAQSLAIFFLFGGFVALGVGLGLFFNSEATVRFFGRMNQWVSLRRATKPLEIPRDTRQAVQRHRRWFAVVFIVGGAFALYGLVAWYDTRAIIFSLRLDFLKPSFSTWALDSARWVLIVGNLTAIGIGLALAFSPGIIEKVETHGSKWYSERQLTKGRDDMRTPLEAKVAAYPRYSGLIMAFFGLVLVCAFGLMLF